MRELVLLLLLIGFGLVFSVLTPVFGTADNLLGMTRYAVEIGLLSLPMTLLIIAGGIDLSVGSMTALCAVAFGLLWQRGLPPAAAGLLAVVTGVGLGAVNGAAVTLARIPPLIVTLATLAFYRGVATALSGGRAIHGFPDTVLAWGDGTFGGIPAQLLVYVAFALVFAVFLARTRWGRCLYALGANEAAARLSGLAVDRLKFLLYAVSGALCGVAGLILVARTTRAKAEGSAVGYELDAIAAAVLGGTNIAGGAGGIVGTVLGLALIQTLRRGLMMLGPSFPSEVQSVIIGLVLILTVWVDQWLRPWLVRRREARSRASAVA